MVKKINYKEAKVSLDKWNKRHKQIINILQMIERTWRLKSSLRFGQFLENYVFSHEGGFDMWNQEDDITEARLKEVLQSETRNE